MMRRTGGMVACAAAALLISGCQPGLTRSVAGTGSYGNTGDSGPATSATLGWPTSVTATPGGGFSFADAVSCTIRHVDGAGIITTIAGNGTCGFSGDGGAATAAQLDISTAFGTAWSGRLAVDGASNHYVFDTGNARIRRIDTDGTVTTFAEDDTGATRCLSGPANRGWLAATSGGVVYMACDWTITSVQAEGTLTPIAVTVNGSPFFGQILGITVDADDNLYASLQVFGPLNGIYAIDPATGVATLVTLYSSNTFSDLARDVSGNFYPSRGPLGRSCGSRRTAPPR